MASRLLILFLVAAASSSGGRTTPPPPIPWEEAPFKDADDIQHLPFEERCYPGGLKWACTSRVLPRIADLTPASAGRLFLSIFAYFQGHNNKGLRFTPAYPSLVTLTKHHTKEKNRFLVNQRVCQYLGRAHQANPPAPKDKKIFLLTTPPLNIVTRRIEGFFSSTSWVLEQVDVMDLADIHFVRVNHSIVHYAQLQPPHAFLHKRNEVWMEKVGRWAQGDNENGGGINFWAVAEEKLGIAEP